MKTECEDDDNILKKTPENITLNIPSSAVEELRCSKCKKYLSHGPIYLLPDEGSICGRCSTNNNLNAVKEVVLERHLQYITFPCSFKQFGCTQQVPFGQASIDHESVCIYRTPFCPRKDCMWEGSEGSLSNIQNHLIEKHANLFKDKASFKIEVDKNAQEVFLVKKDNVIFVIKYLYDNNDGILKYDIRYCNNVNVESVFFKLGLINDSDRKCNMNLKQTSCVSYNFNFHDIKIAHTLNITKLLEFLGDPNCITVTVELFVECNINDKILQTLKCADCNRYLIVPLYKLYKRTVCSDCATIKAHINCEPLTDDKLLHLVTEVEFPCRWQKCEFRGKCKTLRKHESECRLKVYDCWLCSVKELKTTEAIDHYKEKHNVQCMSEKIYFNLNFYGNINELVIANKNNMLILCKFYKSVASDMELYLNSLPTDTNYGTVNIRHDGRNIYSKLYELQRGKWLKIDLKALQPCFKDFYHILTVNVDFH